MPPVSPAPPAADKSKRPAVARPAAKAVETGVPEAGTSPGPEIRIGLLTAAKEIRVSSPGPYYLSDRTAESMPLLLQGDVNVRQGQEVEESIEIFRVQAASFSRAEAAESQRNVLAGLFTVPIVVHENSAAGLYQVRLGEFSKKEDAQALLKNLVEAGYPDAFVVRESVSAGGGKATFVLRGQDGFERRSSTGFLLQPASPRDLLSLNGKPYRGALDIMPDANGRMTVVNQLAMEDYLLGVVPAEISPTQYPEFAALAAQAIAARTYALKNMGRYRSMGFDLSADTRTQVYDGAAAEKEATNEAVRRTSGLAIYYGDQLIDAMYMSTCGGRTEDYSLVFDAPPVPYLKSVFCAVEGGVENSEMILEGEHALEQVILSDEGTVANRNIELARLLGLIDAGTEMSAEFLAGAIGKGEAEQWIRDASRIGPRPDPGDYSSSAQSGTRAGFLVLAAQAFFGADEIERRTSARDVDYYMGNLRDGDAVQGQARSVLAYLMQRGLWHPHPDNTARPDAPMSRGEALFLLQRWVESARPDILRRGTFVDAVPPQANSGPERAIRIKGGSRTQEFPVSPKPRLFRLDRGRVTPVSSLRLIGNEKLSFHVDALGKIDFIEAELNPTGASSDRYSPVATWDMILTRSAVAEKLRPLAGDIGEFRDLQPARLGNSGRAVQIQVVGSRGSAVLNGYKVRNALGLRDTLFTITRELHPDGSIASFRFHGRGWGHGVGLCQVGAFGMARAGRSYEEILKAYYQGVEIRRAY